ncbi:MAG: biopolymer transport protein TolR [Pseudomonadales bacterium]|jgi:biopolymer transport protein TolR
MRAKRRGPMAEINVVPYIDVMLVLLIIFMVTAPLLTQGVQVDLPKAPSKAIEHEDEEPLVVSIKADGSLYINLGKHTNTALTIADIKLKVAAVLRRRPETSILVWGDQFVPYGKVVSLMTELQAAGAPAVGLVTENPPLGSGK